MHFPAQANEPAMDICTNQTPMPSQTNRNARTGRKRKKDVFSGQRTRTGAIFKRLLGLEGRKGEERCFGCTQQPAASDARAIEKSPSLLFLSRKEKEGVGRKWASLIRPWEEWGKREERKGPFCQRGWMKKGKGVKKYSLAIFGDAQDENAIFCPS